MHASGDPTSAEALGRRRHAIALVACVALGAGVRLAHVAQGPTIAPDGPAYVHMAARMEERGWRDALDAYYPPLLPLAMIAVHRATGVRHETAARLVSLAAGIATIALVGLAAGALLGHPVGLVAALLAAIHAHLARASVAVLPEMLFGAMVALWALLLLVPGGAWRIVAGAVVAAVAGGARVEGTALVPLTIVAAAVVAPRGRRLRRAAGAAGIMAAIAVPWLLLVRGTTGAWAVSSKEMEIIARRWDIEGSSLVDVLLHHPLTVLGDYPAHLWRQLGYFASVVLVPLVPLLAVGLVAPVSSPARRARWLTVAAIAVVMLGVATINPGKRYVTPLLPLLLPWAACGVLVVAGVLRERGPVAWRWVCAAAAVGVAALAVYASMPEGRRWAACFPRVCAWLEHRYGRPLPPVMARDGRFAYLCDAPYVHEPRRRAVRDLAPEVTRRGAAAWLLKASRRPAAPPPGLRLVATLCEGRTTLLVYEPE